MKTKIILGIPILPHISNWCGMRNTQMKNKQPLSLRNKLRAFFTAPITKFWGHSFAYIVFLVAFTHMVVMKTEENPSFQELYAAIYIWTLACEEIGAFMSSESVSLSQKLSMWTQNAWNVSDAVGIVAFSIAFLLRFQPSTMYFAHISLCFCIIYWYIRILNILAVNQYFGPLVTMTGKMLKNTIPFLSIIFVVLLSYASCHQSILHGGLDPNWSFIEKMIFKPYFMLYGEVFGDGIFPSCEDDTPVVDCQTGPWISFIQTVIYLFVTNTLLLNLLIAVNNHTFDTLNAISQEVWMFERFRFVMEYEKKPILPPPLSLLCHVFFLFKYCHRKVRGIQESYDSALKLFLDRDALIHLNYFEEECMDSYFKQRAEKSQRSTDECMNNVADKVDRLYQDINDVNQKRNNLTSDIEEVEDDIRKLADLCSHMSSHSAAAY